MVCCGERAVTAENLTKTGSTCRQTPGAVAEAGRSVGRSDGKKSEG